MEAAITAAPTMSAVPALKESWLAALFAVLVDDGADGADDVLVLAEPAAVAPTPLSTTVAESVCCG